ncbi:hypothetical protein H072_6470 [Dactylellina haptotyla CBS 200.50]|uniref:Uncharacterized protein n=1 Tax=Dactylellina haptotyla (strain CBS 200.50) TaxID=1284197 RepID=S8BWL5_DACHA|nr:hypothetical protein H072_6470 [Dactylellina haptotyla CBS 200.50]
MRFVVGLIYFSSFLRFAIGISDPLLPNLTGRQVLSVAGPRRITLRDAFTETKNYPNNEGEDHSKIVPPTGAIFTSIPVSPLQKERIPFFQSISPAPEYVTHAFIVLHGRLRNGKHYWMITNSTIRSARKDGYPGSQINATILAPQFFSAKYNKGQYRRNDLAWADTNAWQAAERAIHPRGTHIDSIDVLDAIVSMFENKAVYPSMKNITIIGHGGGGQLIQRYAALGKAIAGDSHIRYIHGDPSTCVYFTDDRLIPENSAPSKQNCHLFDTWRYGFKGFPAEKNTPTLREDAFYKYITRDVISLIGREDTGEEGDQTCMAKMQGGTKRRDRNLTWWKYINLLAGTSANLDGFPGQFALKRNWRHISNGSINLKLGVVEGVGHDAKDIFSSDTGRSALFSDGVIDVGWRPLGNAGKL